MEEKERVESIDASVSLSGESRKTGHMTLEIKDPSVWVL